MSKPMVRWSLLAVAASPALILAIFIGTYAVDFPYADQWDPGVSGLFIKAHAGELRFADLWAQHNEHRMFLPKLAMLLLGLITHWSTTAESWLEWLLACLTSLGLLVLLRRTIRDDPSITPPPDPWLRILPLWFVVNLFVFSIRQWENWLSGIGLANVMVTTLMVAMVVAATSKRSPIRLTILTAALAVAATVTSGNGFVCWPLGAILLGWSSSRRELMAKRPILLGWLVTFLLVLAIYFAGYQRPPLTPDTPKHYGGLGMLLPYPIAFTGAPFATGMPIEMRFSTMIPGVAQCLLYAAIAAYFFHVWLRRRSDPLWQSMLPWLVLGAFAFGSGMVAAPMRARWGVAQAASSRYATFANFMPICLAVLIPLLCIDIRKHGRSALRSLNLWTQLPAALFGGLIIYELLCTLVILRQYEQIYMQCRSMKAATLLLNVLPGNRFITPPGYPVHAGMDDRARALSRIGYLRPPLIEGPDARAIAGPGGDAPQPPTRWGALEGIQRTAVPNQIVASGWAISPGGVRPADMIVLCIVDPEGREIIIAPGITGGQRPDVAAKLNARGYLNSGWSITGSFPALPPGGRLLLTAWLIDSDTGKAFKLAGQAIYEQ